MTKNNLSVALSNRGTSTGGAGGQTLIDEGIQACRDAMRVSTADAHPVHWAEINGNLAMLHIRMAGFDRVDKRVCLSTALNHIDRALRVFDREAMPCDHDKACKLKKHIEEALAEL